MNFNSKSKDELILELQELQARYDSLMTSSREEIYKYHQFEKALNSSENELQSLFQTMTEGVVLIAPDGRIIQANSSAERILGIFKPEINSRNYIFPNWMIIHPDGTPMPTAEMAGPRAMIEKMPVRDILMGIVRPDSNITWVNVSAAPLLKNNGDLEGVVCTFSDVSESKKVKDLLEETRGNYESFFNTIDDFLFVLDTGGNIIHTNSLVTNRLGYTDKELQGESVLMLHPPERREEAARIVFEMLNGTAESCPVPILAKNGTQIPVETRVTHGFWGGKPVIFGVTKDISKLKLSEEKFSKSFHINPLACGFSDLETHKYVEVNEAFFNFFGFDKSEVIGRTPTELGILTPESSIAIIKNADSNGNVTNAVADLKTKNGEIKHVLLSSENLYVQDKKYRFTVVNDITEQKKSEAEINLKNEKLLRLNVEKDKFFSIIAHDLRSPFNNLLGFTRMMAEELPTMKLDESVNMATSMRNSAIKLFNLLENLLEWSRMQRGITSFVPVSFFLASKVAESIRPFTESAQKKEIGITISIPENLTLTADVKMFESIIRNLVSNAIKFTNKGGKIKIGAISLADHSVQLFIQDTGIGMNKTIQESLFHLDANTNRTGTDGEPTTGLGLILCKEFIEKHGGAIWVESHENIGTTFHFTIPYIE